VISEEKKKLGCSILATQLKLKQQDFAAKQGIKLARRIERRKGSEGICHAIVLESYALPGTLILARTRTRPHVGAIGCVAFGHGNHGCVHSWITKRCAGEGAGNPVRIVIRRQAETRNATAKDFILKISEPRLRAAAAKAAGGKVMEYAGSAMKNSAWTSAPPPCHPMPAEIGGFTGIVAPDKKAVDFPGGAGAAWTGKSAGPDRGLCTGDPDAQYAHAIEWTRHEILPDGCDAGRSGNGKYVARAEHACGPVGLLTAARAPPQ